MRLRQLQHRWKVGDVQDWTVVSEDMDVKRIYENRAPFGDFLLAYTQHRAVPWWRRMWWYAEWDVVEQRMRRLLNEHGTLVWLEKKL